MPAEWTALEHGHHEVCASASHDHDVHADWRMEAGCHGSYYCDLCRLMIDRGRRSYGDGKVYLSSPPDDSIARQRFLNDLEF